MWHFQKGYVIIKIVGVYPERLLALLRKQGVPLKDIVREETGALRCTLPARDFRRLHGLNRSCRCRIRILKKEGGRYALRRLWRRRVFLLGMGATLLCCLWASRRVWLIDVEGCQQMDPAVLRLALEEMGLFPGANARRLYLADIGSALTARYEELSFVSLHVDGVILRVQVREALLPGEQADRSEPCHVVAQKDGIITALVAMRGRAAVQVGEKVKAGQVLISGHVVAWDETMDYYTHAYGEVRAAVSYRGEAKAPAEQGEWTLTGAEAPYGAILWGNRCLLVRSAPFEEYDLAVENTISLSPLPLTVEQGVYRQKEQHLSPLSEAEQRQAALFEAEQAALLQVPRAAKILMLNPYVEERAGELWGVCIVTTEESIGITKEINE